MSIILYLAATPSPSPSPFDEDTVTPGWVGFTVTFLIGVVTILLILDMVRRLRRARYRGEIREQLEAERDAADRSLLSPC
jgi:hypothetical protein